jgi:hypothetical protein
MYSGKVSSPPSSEQNNRSKKIKRRENIVQDANLSMHCSRCGGYVSNLLNLTYVVNKMKTTKNAIEVVKPVSILYKTITFDLKTIFKGLSKAIAHVAAGKLFDVGADTAEIFAGLGLKSTIEENAFVLIRRALFNAAIELAKESVDHFDGLDEHPEDGKALSEAVESKLVNIAIALDRDFFRNPQKLTFLQDVMPIYSQWLVDSGVAPHAAKAISQRLPSYFAYALSAEWRTNVALYQPLKDALDTPFSEADERMQDWENYRALLQKNVDENIFNESFSLRQIYVPLRAYYVQDKAVNDPKRSLDLGGNERPQKKVVVELATELTAWVRARNSNDAIRVLSGGPGSGKSSFTKIFCAEIFQQHLAKPIYIPLHLIDPTREIASEVSQFIRNEGSLRFDPLDPDIQEN